MKITLSWLKTFLETNANLNEIVAKLTSIGLEVESVVDKASELKNFTVAEILETSQHPNADRLRVCRVNTGKEELQIVCGAPNARAGIKVVLAPVGTIIPTNKLEIKASKIRGVDSNGMLCSAAELGIGEDGGGIIELDANNSDIGKKFVDISGIGDPVIEVAITPNRADCLGVYGIARDLAAASLGKLKPVTIKPIKGEFNSPINVNIVDERACPLFIGRYFMGVKNVESPQWLQKHLQSIGLKPISALVDITNYICLSYARPLHVYDAQKLSGNLSARFAKSAKIQALDNKEYELDSQMLVIADDKSPQAIAGVIGSAQSGCGEDTKDVFLEVALFNPDNVAYSGRSLNIVTDSRYRFERKVDPNFVMDAMEIASNMILDICGGSASKPVISGKIPVWQKEITISDGLIEKYSGIKISEKEAFTILESLGFSINKNVISIPSWRPDVEGGADIVEEILRIYGYDKIEGIKPTNDSIVENKPSFLQNFSVDRKIRQLLVVKGFTEVVTWSFMEEKKAAFFVDIDQRLVLRNPISSELGYMRSVIIPNLLDVIVKNMARGFTDLSLFETGSIFKGTKPDEQQEVVTGILSGKYITRNIYTEERNVDVFDAKAALLSSLDKAGAPISSLQTAREAPGYYHPGKSGVFKLGKNILGVFGELHPNILKEWNIEIPVAAFELFLSNIPQVKAKKSTARAKLERSEYQSSKRDFAFIIDESTQAADILKAVTNIDKNLIKEAEIFDIYQGKGITEGKKSVAISILIQPNTRTMNDAELDALSGKIVSEINKLGGVLRV